MKTHTDKKDAYFIYQAKAARKQQIKVTKGITGEEIGFLGGWLNGSSDQYLVKMENCDEIFIWSKDYLIKNFDLIGHDHF